MRSSFSASVLVTRMSCSSPGGHLAETRGWALSQSCSFAWICAADQAVALLDAPLAAHMHPQLLERGCSEGLPAHPTVLELFLNFYYYYYYYFLTAAA